MACSACKSGKASKIFKDCGCGCKGNKQEEKLVASILAAAVFFIVANPSTFRLTRRVIGSWISTPTGCASTKGLLLHAFVFLVVTWALMNVNKERADGDSAIDPMLTEKKPAEKKPAEKKPAEKKPAEKKQVAEEEEEEEEDEEEEEGMAAFKPSSAGVMAPDTKATKHLANVAVQGANLSEVMGAPTGDSISPSPLKEGNYQQCRCADGSSVTLMR
jgi:hypothetical protein